MGENIQTNSVEKPVFPTAYFPSLDYLSKAYECQYFVIESHETFQKQSIRNRCVILGPNGLQSLSVPVKKVNGSKTTTIDIELDYSSGWVKNHLESIQTAYGNYPYFDHYFLDIEQLLSKQWNSLMELNDFILRYLINALSLNYSYSQTEYFNSISRHSFLSFPFIDKSFKNVENKELWGISIDSRLSVLHFLFSFGPLTRSLLLKELEKK